jgi:hypothetical protein
MPIEYLDHLAHLEYVAHLDHLEYLHDLSTINETQGNQGKQGTQHTQRSAKLNASSFVSSQCPSIMRPLTVTYHLPLRACLTVAMPAEFCR